MTVSSDRKGFVTQTGERYAPFGANYFRPNTGWAPQVWKRFDEAATRRDFALMKKLGLNCARVFLSYGSFYMEPGKLDPEGLAKFDKFLAIAEEHGIYVHPTGPDHWEGLPEWAKVDRYTDERALKALEDFWTLFAARHKSRNVIFAYDLLNEPEMTWSTEPLRAKWNVWLTGKYGSLENALKSWGRVDTTNAASSFAPPPKADAPGSRELLDFHHFREDMADEWSRRQVAAIRRADPNALVTVGLIQWSVPSLLPVASHYSAFSPQRQAKFFDFMEVHFYPFETEVYVYRGKEDELRNLAYLQSVVREVWKQGKPVVLAEFGWYGGGKPGFDGGRHPAASEEQQARWCSAAVRATAGMAAGWLNWGLYDQPEATDASEFTGMLRPDGTVKKWGEEAGRLARLAAQGKLETLTVPEKPDMDWLRCITSVDEGRKFRESFIQEFRRLNEKRLE